ncbi:MAG: tail fiber domain-containing protein [Myxococcales bacterium]|nr:tail fiber domain-containing protein [Myxococcales bacterium]
MSRSLLLLAPALGACVLDAVDLPEVAPAQLTTTQRSSTSDFPGGGCFHDTDNPGGTPLQDIIDLVGPTGTLVVDQTCTLTSGLVIPDRFTLRGSGWAGQGILVFDSTDAITFDGGTDDDAHATVENLQLEGTGAGTAFQIFGHHNVHLRRLIVRNFEIGAHGRTSWSVDVDHCNFSLNDVGIRLGYNANTWRITGGIVSQNDVGLDLHDTGLGNDIAVLGVRMESNDTAVRIAGQSTYVAFNRFEGNTIDVEETATATGTVLFANNTAAGTASDLSQLNDNGITGLPRIDRELQLSFVPGGLPSAQVYTDYVAAGNLLRTQLLANQYTEDGVLVDPGYAEGYAGWLVQLDGTTLDATSALTVSYRSPGDAGPPTEVFRLNPDGTVEATAFVATSDVRRKTDFAPLDGAVAKLSHLRGMQYAWADGPSAGKPSMGLLAQEVQQVFPTAVTDTEGALRVNHDQLMAPMVEAIKELAADNEALREDIAALRAALDDR